MLGGEPPPSAWWQQQPPPPLPPGGEVRYESAPPGVARKAASLANTGGAGATGGGGGGGGGAPELAPRLPQKRGASSSFTCAICMETCREPVTVLCGAHNACLECLRAHISSRLAAGVEPRCPECRGPCQGSGSRLVINTGIAYAIAAQGGTEV